MGVWEVLSTCGRQLRAHMGGPFALDYHAVLATGSALRVDLALLAEMLPIAETAILSQFEKEGDDET